jgi:hypothetical protein
VTMATLANSAKAKLLDANFAGEEDRATRPNAANIAKRPLLRMSSVHWPKPTGSPKLPASLKLPASFFASCCQMAGSMSSERTKVPHNAIRT